MFRPMEKNLGKPICVLAYSGGLDTSAIIPWLKENHQVEVIAYCCNVGNLPPEKELRDRAIELGAKDFVFEDAEEEFVQEFVFPMLRAGATYFEDYLLGTAIARPLIALRVARFAQKVGAQFIAHGATGKGNDHIRFEKTWAYLVPHIKVIAPWKHWEYRSRIELAQYLQKHNYPWNDEARAYSVDLNTLHRSCEGGVLEDIDKEFPLEKVVDWLDPKPKAEPITVRLSFKDGVPVSVNTKKMAAHVLLAELNKLASPYGIGLCDIVEERANGIKSHGVYETPGGTLIHTAMKSLKQLVWSGDMYRLAQSLGDKYGELVYKGDWFTDTRFAAEAFFKAASSMLTGEITLELRSGQARVVARASPNSLYKPSVVSFESDDQDIHKASLGYGRILTLPIELQGKRDHERGT